MFVGIRMGCLCSKGMLLFFSFSVLFADRGRTICWGLRWRYTDSFSRVIEAINKYEGVEWVKMEDICDTFKAKNKPPKGAVLPAKPGAILENPNLELERAT